MLRQLREGLPRPRTEFRGIPPLAMLGMGHASLGVLWANCGSLLQAQGRLFAALWRIAS
jgi:hypothetical protein